MHTSSVQRSLSPAQPTPSVLGRVQGPDSEIVLVVHMPPVHVYSVTERVRVPAVGQGSPPKSQAVQAPGVSGGQSPSSMHPVHVSSSSSHVLAPGQGSPGPSVHHPATQVSGPLQNVPSSQGVLSSTGSLTQPISASQRSAVHGLPSSAHMASSVSTTQPSKRSQRALAQSGTVHRVSSGMLSQPSVQVSMVQSTPSSQSAQPGPPSTPASVPPPSTQSPPAPAVA
jgi:hypothetical protein